MKLVSLHLLEFLPRYLRSWKSSRALLRSSSSQTLCGSCMSTHYHYIVQWYVWPNVPVENSNNVPKLVVLNLPVLCNWIAFMKFSQESGGRGEHFSCTGHLGQENHTLQKLLQLKLILPSLGVLLLFFSNESALHSTQLHWMGLISAECLWKSGVYAVIPAPQYFSIWL